MASEENRSGRVIMEDANDGRSGNYADVKSEEGTVRRKKNDDKDNDQEVIHLMIEFYSMLERQGPGNVSVTKRALDLIRDYENGMSSTSVSTRGFYKAADIGCGTGGQTMTLAEELLKHHDNVDIVGIDMASAFIDILNSKAEALNFQNEVRGVVGFMDQLDDILEENSLDLIWSEGGIYNVGFAKGLQQWRPYLKDGGYIAVTELSWLTNFRPKEIETFWKEEYSEIDTISNKLRQMEESGYVPVASFVLPQSCWFIDYYRPQEKAMEEFIVRYNDNQMAKNLIQSQQHEIDLYRQYKDYYGYAFYIGRKQKCCDSPTKCSI